MNICRFAIIGLTVTVTVLGGGAQADELPLPAGLYQIEHSLELPHLERYAIAQKATVCVGTADQRGRKPLPVLSGNGAFAGCSARNIKRDGANFTYEIVCEGRGAARATAVYTLAPGRFRGRIAMVLGAKNMTMTEVQGGRRLGSCDVAGIRLN